MQVQHNEMQIVIQKPEIRVCVPKRLFNYKNNKKNQLVFLTSWLAG